MSECEMCNKNEANMSKKDTSAENRNYFVKV